MRLIEAVRDLPKVCKHFHLPVQSGSTRVLAAMRRRYTRESYLELVAHAPRDGAGHHADDGHDRGFPGETDADFDETMSLTAAVRYESMFSFKYSPRPNTLALKRYPDDVSEQEKTRRIVALQALQREIQIELHEAAVGSDGRGAGRFGQPAARLGAVGPHVRQHRREFSRTSRVARAHRAGAHHARGRLQPRGQLHLSLDRPVSRPSVRA